MAVVLLLLDALRYDYLTERGMPFLSECAAHGSYFERIVPSFGFCERSEILTGLRASESGFFTAVGFDPADSPYDWTDECILRLAEAIEPLIPKNLRVPGRATPGGFHRYYRSLVTRMIRARTGGVSPYCIPARTLRSWALTEDRVDHRERSAFRTPSILARMTEVGLTYYYESFTALTLSANGSDRDRLALALSQAGAGHELYLVYQGAPDTTGHRFGPRSPQRAAATQQLDMDLAEFVREFSKVRPSTTFIFLGDHGMLDVQTTFDAAEALRQLARMHRARLKNDYLYFLDSTMVRLWSFSRKGDDLIEAARQDSTFARLGAFVDGNASGGLGVPSDDRRYGDAVWCASPGVLVFPDFFHRDQPALGMHGYDPQIKESQGLCIVHGDNVAPMRVASLPLTGVFDLLCSHILPHD